MIKDVSKYITAVLLSNEECSQKVKALKTAVFKEIIHVVKKKIKVL